MAENKKNHRLDQSVWPDDFDKWWERLAEWRAARTLEERWRIEEKHQSGKAARMARQHRSR